MARKAAVSVTNKFSKGFITESTALNFPQDGATDILNCTINNDGKVARRKALSYEPTPVEYTLGDGKAYIEYVWNSVANAGSKKFLVQQQGDTLSFFDISSGLTNVAGQKKSFTVDLNTYLVSTSPFDPGRYPVSMVGGNGDLIVCSPVCDPFYVRYDSGSDAITTAKISILARDFDGRQNFYAINDRPATDIAGIKATQPNHYYNLLNQGWHAGSSGTSGNPTASILASWDTARGDVPSMADTTGTCRLSAATPFDNATVNSSTPGSRQAPNGHFIINIHRNDAQQAAATNEGFTGFTLTTLYSTIYQRPQGVTFYSGRIWYTGANHKSTIGRIYFSQIVKSQDDYGACYQKNDPTSIEFFDLLADDGGMIRIPEADIIYRLFPYQAGLVVFASNGVWMISGLQRGGFAANSFEVRKLSNIGITSFLSLVDVKGTPIWWSEDGIYTIQFNANYNSFEVVSLTIDTIKSWYLQIPKSKRALAKGAYDLHNDNIVWLYSDNDTSDPDDWFVYNKALCFNNLIKAFYPWSFDLTPDKLHGVVYLSDPANIDTPRLKYVTSLDGSSEFLLLEDGGSFLLLEDGSSFFTLREGNTYTYRDLMGEDYLDLFVYDYDSYLISGYRLDGELTKYVQANYVFVYLDPQDNASCKIQGVFDFTTSGNSGKWSTPQEGYIATPYKVVQNRRLKVRGKGKALQLKFSSTTGRPFTISGWAIKETGNADV